LLVGFVFYNQTDLTGPGGIIAVMNMVDRSTKGTKMLNKNAYNASYATAAISHHPGAYPLLTTSEWRNDAYDFCSVYLNTNISKNSELPNDINATRIECALLIFNLYDNIDKSTSLYNYQFVYGSCNNSLNLSEAAWYVYLTLTYVNVLTYIFDEKKYIYCIYYFFYLCYILYYIYIYIIGIIYYLRHQHH
jgi:hypothetical protein